ncbi:MAG TPA: cellulase [Luteibacter sp.]|jgi:photosystem II stability/assembly factor-like uncharacterized protein|nr:cellulase [Luteibacter sp.]
MQPFQRSSRRNLPWILVVILFAMRFCATATAAETYAWHSVRIGGGGYVSGLVFHPRERGLYYARTDVGGAYRWDAASSRWIAITDWIDADEANLAGIDSLALDPNDPDRVYLAAGTYTSDKVGNGAILRSTDRGKTFQRADLPFKLGGNELGRGNGERLAVDPNDGRTLLFGSRGAGLWRSDDHGAHWAWVDTFPAVATAPSATAENRWRRQAIGIVFVVYEPTTGKPGQPTPTVFAGVSTRETSLFRSDDGGRHWVAVAGQPVGLRPNHMRRGGDGTYYLSYGDEPGPDTMHDGAVWKYEPSTNRWTDITPIPRNGKPSGNGWGDIAIDPVDPKVLMASTFALYTPQDLVFRSVDGGLHWANVFARSRFDHSAAPWTKDHTPHWMSTLAIDPFDSDHAMFVTGYGIWASRDLRGFDEGHEVNWWFQDEGLEETVPLGLVSPSRGVPLVSAVGDLDGFLHGDLDKAPPQLADPPRYTNGEGIDVAALAPRTFVRAGRMRNASTIVRAAYSLDGATSWQAFATEPGESNGAGSIAIAADASAVLWFADHAAHAFVTRDYGKHWTPSEGLPASAQVFADRVDPKYFYAYAADEAKLFVSRDGAMTFQPVAGAFAMALGAGKGAHAYALPGSRGELYIASPSAGLIHGRDDGSLIVHDSHFDAADSLGFGKAAVGTTKATLFVAGKRDGKRGIYRSTDDGATWLRINDDSHQFGQVGYVTGDPRVFGRVYFATGGRGIFYGEPLVSPNGLGKRAP